MRHGDYLWPAQFTSCMSARGQRQDSAAHAVSLHASKKPPSLRRADLLRCFCPRAGCNAQPRGSPAVMLSQEDFSTSAAEDVAADFVEAVKSCLSSEEA